MYVMPITSYRGKKDDGKAISFAYSRYCWASLHARVDALQTVWTLDSFSRGKYVPTVLAIVQPQLP